MRKQRRLLREHGAKLVIVLQDAFRASLVTVINPSLCPTSRMTTAPGPILSSAYLASIFFLMMRYYTTVPVESQVLAILPSTYYNGRHRRLIYHG